MTSVEDIRGEGHVVGLVGGSDRAVEEAPPAPTRGAGRLAAVALTLMALAITIPAILWLLTPAAVAGGGRASLASDFLNEARAIGGTRLGVAVALGIAALSARTRPAGLVVGIAVFGCTFLGRLMSNALDGAPGPMAKPEIAELVLVALAFFALKRGSAPTGARRISGGGR